MRTSRSTDFASENLFDPKQIPLEELFQIERNKVKDLDFSEEPQVCVSWSEFEELLPMSSSDFKHSFSYTLAKNADKCGFVKPRLVQQAIIPFVNYGCNVCIATAGCTGKSVGYMLPLIQKVFEDLERLPRRSGCPRAVIVAPNKEKAKCTFNLLRVLTDGLGVNVCLSVNGMASSHFAARDRADITVLTPKTLYNCLNDSKINLALVKTLVLEGADDLPVPAPTAKGVVYLEEILKFFDMQTRISQMIVVAEDISFLQSEFYQKRIFNAENVVVIDNGKNRLSPSNHALLRVNKRSMARALVQLIKNYDQGKVLVLFNRFESHSELVENEVKAALENAGITYFAYRNKLDIVERTEVQRRFAQGERQVLIMQYCNQVRSLRVPGLCQVIHVEPPLDANETYESSYNFSSSCVAFNRAARSVVLCHTDNQKHIEQIAKIAKEIENVPLVDGWTRNKVPLWAAEFMNGEKKSWTAEDAEAAEEMWDLKEAAMIPSGNNWETKEPFEDYEDDGYRREMEDNWDYRGIVTNAVNYSFGASPSPVPIGDVDLNYEHPENFDPYANSYPQERYVQERQEHAAIRDNSHWNDGRDRDQGGYEGYEEPDDVPKYEDFEEKNIGYEESRSNGRSRTTSSSSSYYDYQDPRYRQKNSSNRRDLQGQESQEYNDGAHQGTYGTEGTSRQFEDLQNQPSQCSPQKMSQYNEWDWDDHPMTQRHESSDERLQMDRPQRSSGNSRFERQQEHNDSQFTSAQRHGNRFSYEKRPAQNQKPDGNWDDVEEPRQRRNQSARDQGTFVGSPTVS